jgi:hypothetical protein
LGGESTSAFLFFGISQHTNRLSLGFEVSWILFIAYMYWESQCVKSYTWI